MPRTGCSRWSNVACRSSRHWLKARGGLSPHGADGIATAPPRDRRWTLEERLGYRDGLLPGPEPYALWAIEADPAELRVVFPVESSTVVFAPDIAFYRER